jgi:hypothetical protein
MKTKNLVMLSMATTAFAGWVMVYQTYRYFTTLNNAGIDFSWLGVFVFFMIGAMGVPFALMRKERQKESRINFAYDSLDMSTVVYFLLALWYAFYKIDYGFALSGEMLNTTLSSIFWMLAANAICFLEAVLVAPKAIEAIENEKKKEQAQSKKNSA